MRFVKTHNNGFLGRFAYAQVVPQDSFLRKLRDLMSWDRLTDRFVTMYVGKAEHGRPPYHPVLAFKCLFVTYLYNLSKRSVEWFCHSTFEGRLSLDVGMSDPTPDHSTLSLFRSRRSRWSRIEAPKEPDEPESKEKRCQRMEERYTIEAKFGEAKAWHLFGRSHYRGQAGHIAPAFLTMMVLT